MEFRLPSEAEWEYACRAGMTSRYYWGGDSNYGLLQNHAYTTYYTYPNTFTGPRMTGLLLPNNFGLYDMCGNVMEWCEDDWHDNYLGAPTDGSAWVNGPNPSREHPLRGGFFYSTYEQLRSSSRSNSAYWPGFRVVLAAPKKP
jgi:formylglycine-generating enzyme required for sulfatase activity